MNQIKITGTTPKQREGETTILFFTKEEQEELQQYMNAQNSNTWEDAILTAIRK